ncbi:hypothetical protein DXG01_013341 [Tephrocybe rancida]|nr:hypothetical protein DXG01_013341 [Tephrocybe rancida]
MNSTAIRRTTTQRHAFIHVILDHYTDRNIQIAFAFDAENLKRAQEIISHYPPQYKKAAVIPLLDLGQRQNKGWTSISVMNYVAKLLEMPPMRVYEEDLTPTTTKKVLDAFSKGVKPKPGPQSGRRTSENSAGLTNLTGKPYGPGEFCTPEFQ